MKETILTTKLRIKTPLPGLRVHLCKKNSRQHANLSEGKVPLPAEKLYPMPVLLSFLRRYSCVLRPYNRSFFL